MKRRDSPPITTADTPPEFPEPESMLGARIVTLLHSAGPLEWWDMVATVGGSEEDVRRAVLRLRDDGYVRGGASVGGWVTTGAWVPDQDGTETNEPDED